VVFTRTKYDCRNELNLTSSIDIPMIFQEHDMNLNKPESSTLYKSPHQVHSRIRYELHKERCLYYITKQYQRSTTLNHSERVRLSLSDYFYDLQTQQNRILFHLTVTYKPITDQPLNPRHVDKFFKEFYLYYFLPQVMGTRNYHKVHKKSIQPITMCFLDEHTNDKFRHQDTPKLHHHVMIGIHPDTLSNFTRFVGLNLVDTNLRFTTPILTTNLVLCEPMTVLYTSKLLHKYPDFMSFPDKYHRVRNQQPKYPCKSKRIH